MLKLDDQTVVHPTREHRKNVAHEKLFVGGNAHPNERRAAAKANHFRKPCGKEKEWTDCVQSDIRAFGITGDWKATALKAEVWVETVTNGGRRFMAAWRK